MPKTLSMTLNAAVLILLAGCAVGPDYRAPAHPALAVFNAPHHNGKLADAERHFWQGFEDPLLAQLVEETLEANQTLQSGMARYQQAAAMLDGARRDQWPSITASASAAETHPAAVEFVPGGNGGDRVETYQAGISASWEADLFGRLRRVSESRRAELEAADADIGALQVSLVGQLAGSYFRLRGLQAQYRVAEQNVELYESSLDIVAVRVDAGRDTEFDRVRARAQLERAQAALPTLNAEVRATMHRIAVLTGRTPAELIETLSTEQALPAVVPTIPVDSPAAIMRRRPDIVAAERRLAAATARIGVAVADLFPRFTLGGLLGSMATDSGDLFSGSTESRNMTLGVDWTFLDHGRVRARIDAADAESRAALADYQQAVLLALEEAETRLVYYDRLQQNRRHMQQAEAQAQQAVTLARTRYENGLIDYFEVLSAEQELASARDAAVRSRTAEVVAMVDVYRALAGAPE